MAEPLEFRVKALSTDALKDMDALRRKLVDLEDALKPVDDESEKASRGVDELGDKSKKAAGQVDDLGKEAKKAPQSFGQMSKSLLDVGKSIAGLFVVREAIQLIKELGRATGEALRSTIEYGDGMATAAQKIGISARELETLAFVANRSDVSFQELTTGIRFSQRAFDEAAQGVAEYKEVVDRLGVDLVDNSGRMREFIELLPEIAEAMGNLESATERGSIAMQLFGRAGTALIPLFDQGAEGIRELTERADDLSVAMSPRLEAAVTEADDAMKDITASWTAMRREALVPVIELLPEIAEDLDTIRRLAKDHNEVMSRGPDIYGALGTAIGLFLEQQVPLLGFFVSLHGWLQDVNAEMEDLGDNFQEAATSASNLGAVDIMARGAAEQNTPGDIFRTLFRQAGGPGGIGGPFPAPTAGVSSPELGSSMRARISTGLARRRSTSSRRRGARSTASPAPSRRSTLNSGGSSDRLATSFFRSSSSSAPLAAATAAAGSARSQARSLAAEAEPAAAEAEPAARSRRRLAAGSEHSLPWERPASRFSTRSEASASISPTGRTATSESASSANGSPGRPPSPPAGPC
jgi:hypothetical protein